MASVLYAALGGSSTTSDLYMVDPTTGALTSVGPIGFALTGLAIDPTTGTCYGVTNNNSASHPRALITVDLTSGAGTLVADLTGNGGAAASDIAFDSSGQLWGWNATGGGLWSINKTTGAVTPIGSLGSDYSGGLDFLGSTLWHFIGQGHAVETVNTSTGAVTFVSTPSDTTRLQAGKFNPDDSVFWGVQTGAGGQLVTIDQSTGTVTDIAVPTIGGSATTLVDALVWGPPLGPFALHFSPTSISLDAGVAGSDTTTLTSTLTGGSGGTATLSASGAPSGMTIGFSATSINESGGTSTITVTTTSSVTPGTYSITIHAAGEANVTGTFTVVVSADKTVLATADPNTSSPTVTVTGTGVIDSQVWIGDQSPDFFSIDDLNLEPTPTFYVRGTNLPAPGAYKVVVNAVATDTSPTTERFAQNYAFVIHVNGHLFGFAPFVLEVDSNSAYGLVGSLNIVLTGPPKVADPGSWLGGPPYYGIKSGDEITIAVINDGRDPADTSVEVQSVDFIYLAAGGPGPAIDLGTVENLPLGATAWTDAGLAAAIVAGDAGEPNCKDICVTDNGDVYVVVSTFLSASPASNGTGVITLWKWGGTSWTEISSNFAGNTRGKPTCSISTDGTNVFIAWGEISTAAIPAGQGNPTSAANYVWRCAKYTPGSGFTEIGSTSGQANAMPASRTQLACDAGAYECAVTLHVAPDGKPWVAWCETDDSGSNPQFSSSLLDDLSTSSFSGSWDQSGLIMRSTTIAKLDSTTTTRYRAVPSAATSYMNVARYTGGGTYGHAQEASATVDVLNNSATGLYAEVGVMLQAPVDLGGGRIEYPGYYARWSTNGLVIIKKTGTGVGDWTETTIASGAHNASVTRDPTVLSIRATPLGPVGGTQTGTQITAWIANVDTAATAYVNNATDRSSFFSDGYVGFGLRRDSAATYPTGETPAIVAADYPPLWSFKGGSVTTTGSEGSTRPYLWRWDGSAWQDTGLPDPDVLRVDGYGATYDVNDIHIDPQIQVDFTFHHHDGPNANPSAVYCASYYPHTTTDYVNSSGILNEMIYQEFDGTSWSTQVKTHLEIFVNTDGDRGLDGVLEQGLISPSFTPTQGTAQQGMRLTYNGSNIILGYAGDRALVLQLASDGSAWEPYLGKYKQPDYIHRKDYRQNADLDVLQSPFFAWDDPTGIDLVADDQGRVWGIYDWQNSLVPFYSTGVFVDQDPGSGIGWMAIDGRNPLPVLDTFTFSRLCYHNDKLYVLVLADTGVNTSGVSTVLVFEVPISRAAYVPFVLGGTVISTGAHARLIVRR